MPHRSRTLQILRDIEQYQQFMRVVKRIFEDPGLLQVTTIRSRCHLVAVSAVCYNNICFQLIQKPSLMVDKKEGPQ